MVEHSQSFYVNVRRVVAFVGWGVVFLVVTAVGASVYTVGRFLLGLF